MRGAIAGREGLLTSAWYGALFFAFGAHLPYWPVWLANWGLTEAEIGAYFGLAMAVRIPGSMLLPALADRFAQRRSVVVGAALVAATVFLLHLGIGARPVLLAATLTAAFFTASLIPIGEALGLRASEIHGFPYSHARAVGSLAFLVMNLGLGAAIARLGPGVVLWAVVLCFLVVAGLGLMHPGGGAPPGAGRDQARWREALGLLAQPVFLVFALAASIGQASHAVYYAYGTLTWLGQGIGSGVIGALWATAVMAEILLMLGRGRVWVARLGPARALLLGSAAGMLRWGLMSLEPPLALLWPVQALHALTFGLGHLGAMAFVAAAVPPRLQASAQGLYGGGIGGLAITLASLAASAIIAGFGIASAYWLAAAMSAVALGAALWLGQIWDGGRVAPDQT